ncbi:glycoside hydrolase family 172 protein [Tichowtungia aerotolerans]|uniref:DUF2961 domain-containing protein n=1 Tax=Tichowtungia aerotolerans TaxID=2697043 RepID=A0A6P1M0I2_9BACT|nr:glycoside hydrolase family 172 protein [Tichowtungia aerotolerans]QHI68060.1 DUF2961 domain-containing protein [Tichowtungia aerotolerans]
MKIHLGYFLLPLCLCVVSCSQKEPVETSWAQLIQELYNPGSIADLSKPCTDIRTSYDRSGGNNDYSNGYKNLGNGWLELADFKGAGVLTRFWFTGIKREVRFRFIFDDETEPRLETTSDALYKGLAGFPSMFTMDDQNCYYSGFPIPYRRRLRILMSDEGYSQGKGKLYFHINATPLEKGTVRSAVFPIPQEVRSACESVAWPQKIEGEALDASFAVLGGTKKEILDLETGGVIRSLRLELEGWETMSFHQRQLLLRQVWLNISWDLSDMDSVKVPLGDFFGQMWEPKKLQNLYFTVDETGFECRFPMPFRKAASFTLENRGTTMVAGRVLLKYQNGPVPAEYGYFHSSWKSSSEKQTGTPHEVLDVNGKGRLVGCLLGAASMDRNFWVLESDETILRDNSKEVFWQGTGLEDYFNGGWYYRTVFQNPLFGLTLKRPFRTVQYRYHLADPITFSKSLNMSFERGPGNQSRGAFDSVAYYYLDRPSSAYQNRFVSSYPVPPADEFESRSLMTRLWDYEKFDDWTNAEKLTQHALKHWKYPLEIKQILDDRLSAYTAGTSDLNAPDKATVFVYSSKKSEVFLDGKQVVGTADPVRTQFAQILLEPGRHVMVVKTESGVWPDWVQAGLKIGGFFVGIDSTWACSLSPSGNYHDLSFNDEDWIQPISLCKGPPEQEAVPFVFPDKYVGFQSMLNGVRVQKLPPGWKSTAVFRKVFIVPQPVITGAGPAAR